jgi:hypothetical protein
MFARLIFSIVDFSARKGLSAADAGDAAGESPNDSPGLRQV